MSGILLAMPADIAERKDGSLVNESVVTIEGPVLDELTSRRADLPAVLDQVEIRSITYLSDGLRVNGYLVEPKAGENLPCIIVNRGGAGGNWVWSDFSAAMALADLASWGYIVLASQYRGCGGGEGADEFGGRDVNDVLNLIPLLRSRPRADEIRIGMCGWSRGGIMTLLAMARTDAIAAAVIGGAPADLFALVQRRPEMETEVCAKLIPNYETEKQAALTARSAILWPEKLNKTTPLLILQGTADWRNDPSDALAFASKLLTCRHPFRLVMFEGGDHNVSEFCDESQLMTRTWLDRYVRDRQPWPSLQPHGP